MPRISLASLGLYPRSSVLHAQRNIRSRLWITIERPIEMRQLWIFSNSLFKKFIQCDEIYTQNRFITK